MSDNTPETIILAIKEMMHRKKYNQAQMAKIFGMHESQLSRWLNGKHRPNTGTVELLAVKLSQLEGILDEMAEKDSQAPALTPPMTPLVQE